MAIGLIFILLMISWLPSPLSEAPFNFESPIINQAITTLVNKPYQITGYLEHSTVIQSILDALKPKKQPH